MKSTKSANSWNFEIIEIHCGYIVSLLVFQSFNIKYSYLTNTYEISILQTIEIVLISIFIIIPKGNFNNFHCVNGSCSLKQCGQYQFNRHRIRYLQLALSYSCKSGNLPSLFHFLFKSINLFFISLNIDWKQMIHVSCTILVYFMFK